MRFIFVLIVLSSASGSAYFTTARNSSGAEEPRARGAAEFTDRTPHVLAPPEEPTKAPSKTGLKKISVTSSHLMSKLIFNLSQKFITY